MPIAMVSLADTHTWSVFGLSHPDDVRRGSPQADMQKWIWECSEHARTIWVPSIIGNLPRGFIHAGDSVEGLHHDKAGVSGTDLIEMADGATRVLKKWTEGSVLTLMCAGTCAHVGGMGELDNLVARQIGAEPDAAGRFAPFEVRHCIDGVLFHLSHHIGGSYVDASDMTPLVGEWTAMAAAAVNPAYPMPDIIMRGHSHIWRNPYEREGKSVIALPGWQGLTPHAYKLRRPRAKPADIGLCVVICDEGTYKIEHKLYAWPQPTIRSFGWNPTHGQDSAPNSSPVGSPPGNLRKSLTALVQRLQN